MTTDTVHHALKASTGAVLVLEALYGSALLCTWSRTDLEEPAGSPLLVLAALVSGIRAANAVTTGATLLYAVGVTLLHLPTVQPREECRCQNAMEQRAAR